MDLLLLRRSPYFGAEQAQASLNQPVIEVRQNDIVAALGGIRIERNRPFRVGVRMFEAQPALSPTGVHEMRDGECSGDSGHAGWNQLRLARQVESDVHDGLDVFRREVKLAAGLVKLLGEALDLFAHILLETQQ